MPENVSREEAQELRAKLDDLKRDLADLGRLAKDKVVTGTSEWAKEHPAATVGIIAGIAASIGFAIGMMMGRNRG